MGFIEGKVISKWLKLLEFEDKVIIEGRCRSLILGHKILLKLII
jgi:hypothetical protein